jgi:hypothetical protein
MRKAVPTEMLSTAQRSMKASRGSQRDQRQEARALSSEDHSTHARARVPGLRAPISSLSETL